MKVRVLGGGWYGCHIATALLADGHRVELHESARHLFAGASGAQPARLHLGFHYPRSASTRAACLAHNAEFMRVYGFLTHVVPVNLYAVADESLVDFDTYTKILGGEVGFLGVYDPEEFGLRNVEGAVLTGERHVIIDKAREHFSAKLNGKVRYGVSPVILDDPRWDLTIDATFCALDSANVDRYEPCLTVLLEGPTDKAVTIMDGPFPSLYPWNEEKGLSSLTSALLTPFSKTCKTWHEARRVLDGLEKATLIGRAFDMLEQMERYYPGVRESYRIADFKLAVRAMPKSKSDSRLVDVRQVGTRSLRIRAGKLDAIFSAAEQVRTFIAAKKTSKRARAS